MKRLSLLVPVFLIGIRAFAADPVVLKSSREIFASYAAIMNVSESDPGLRELYRVTADRLPRTGQPQELSNTVIMATTELGGAFCAKALEREKALPHGQRTLFSDVDFKRGPSQFSAYLKGVLLDHLAMAFWQRDAIDAEKMSISKTMDQAVKGEADSVDETLKQMQILCTTYATSLAFLVK